MNTYRVPKTTRENDPMPANEHEPNRLGCENISWRNAVLIVIGILVFLLITPPAQAADKQIQVSFEQAKYHLDNEQFEKAYQEFYELFKLDPANPEINFYLGRCAFGNRDYEAAIMAFDRVLIARPDADRVKLELARCHYELGSTEAAKQYFEEVLASDPPDNVRKNIQQYLRAIKKTRKKHFLSARVSLGMDWDDNANVAPTSSEVDITTALGDVIPISVDRPERDIICSSTLNFNYLYKNPDSALGWKISGVNYNASYQDVEDLDINLFDIKAGLSIQGGHIIWDLYGIANHLNLDYEQYLRSFGGGSSLTLYLRPNFLLTLDGKYKKKNYFETNERDAQNISVSFTPAFSLDQNRITTTFAWEYENAQDDVNTYSRMSTIVSYVRQLPWGFSLLANYWYQGTDYNDENSLFNKKRSDDVQYFIAGISKSLWQSDEKSSSLLINAGYTYTRADSNIDLYQYTKNVASASLTFAF
jgi:tetratricopeptide (TPR) repeat protein